MKKGIFVAVNSYWSRGAYCDKRWPTSNHTRNLTEEIPSHKVNNDKKERPRAGKGYIQIEYKVEIKIRASARTRTKVLRKIQDTSKDVGSRLNLSIFLWLTTSLHISFLEVD
jgi:hypothetical protein